MVKITNVTPKGVAGIHHGSGMKTPVSVKEKFPKSWRWFGVVALVFAFSAPAQAADSLSAPDSVWNKSLPSSPRPTEPDGSIAAAFKDSAHGTNWISADSYSTPFYVVPNNQPTVPVTLDSFRSGTTMQDWLDQGVPIPPGAKQAAGSDGHISVWQPFRDKLWSCWAASKIGGQWHAQTCQGTNHVSQDPGYATNDSWDPFTNSAGFDWTSTATGLAVIHGTMTLAQVRAHQIGHALAVDTNNVCGSYYSWPAQDHDGSSPTGDCVPEGAKVFFGTGVQCGPLIQMAETICNALKNKGGIVRDSTVTGIGLFVEDTEAAGLGDPYYAGEQLFGGQYPSTFLSWANFPWSSIKVAPLHRCTNDAVPCLP